MQERIFENLILDGKDCFLEGDITITGKLEIRNANLIVAGDITISSQIDIEIVNGDIIVSGTLSSVNTNINIISGNICCDSLCCFNINISDGDIWTHADLDAKNITSDGNIEIGGDSNVEDVSCLNYLVTGYNNAECINAFQDIYILGDNDSLELSAREILINGNCDTHLSSITAHHFVCGGDLYCSELLVE